MVIYDYVSGEAVEISESQYDFMQAVIKSSGRMEEARKIYAITDEQLAAWKNDPVFWPVLEGHVAILLKARGLTPEYIKAYLIDTLYGKKDPTKSQMGAINASVRALGMGLNPRTGINGKVVVTPTNTQIEFKEIPIDGE